MSEYQVGQRVRVVYAATAEGKRFVGCESVVVEIIECRDKMLHGLECCGIEFGCDEETGEPFFCGWAASQLTPIIPDGHRPSEYTLTELLDRLKAGEVECV